MKKSYYLFVLVLFFANCKTTRLHTEGYIKNNIQKHYKGGFNDIQIYLIKQQPIKGKKGKGGGYIELVGYKYNNEAGLVFALDKKGMVRKSFLEDDGYITPFGVTHYYKILTIAECKEILTKYNQLLELAKEDNRVIDISNTIHFDYTLSDDFYFSIEKIKRNKNYYKSYVHFWVSGQKYTLFQYLDGATGVVEKGVMNDINSFIKWAESN